MRYYSCAALAAIFALSACDDSGTTSTNPPGGDTSYDLTRWGSGPYCSALADTFNGCDLTFLMDGENCEEPDDAQDACEFQCAAESSCSDLTALVCGDEFDPFEACVDNCEANIPMG